ncbi:MAG: hypothetical protein PHG35_07000 [Dehalococcoidales bacterium]|nr:hypothetical protein [Dehalococcoidales bacterium]
MKSRRIVQLLGISLILILLFVVLPVSPVLAANTITLTPTQGVIGATISLHGEFEPTYTERWGIIYVSNIDKPIGAVMSTVASYERVVSAVLIPAADLPNPGVFNCNITIPSALADGVTEINVTAGQYYVYMTTTVPAGESPIIAKASLTIGNPATPALDALSPASGPAGTIVTVSGSDFPASTALEFKFDTTVLTPSSGNTSVSSTGVFISTLTIPSTATLGAHTITVTADTTVITATFTVSGATIVLSPTSGTAGASVTINGTAFPVSSVLTFRFDSTTITPTSGNTTTSGTGTFASVITIPTSATTGNHTITALAGTATATATYGVTGGGIIALTINPTSGAVGIQVTISGSGFTANQAFTVTWDDVATTSTGTVDTSGVVALTYTIPAAIHGIHTIGVTDGTHTGEGTFTIEATPPSTPQPLRPYMNEGVSAPITLDWEDATDSSAPVTYSVQVSSSESFTSLLIDKTGLGTSQYIITDSEMLSFTAGQTYYWRERAVDAASNASEWTGANAFVLEQGFSFSGWVMWVTIAVVGVILFLLGIWIGRKTAYSY